MRRIRLVAGAWLAGTAVSALLAAVLIGCCALPFHADVHRFAPCHVARAALAEDEGGSPDRGSPGVPPPPQRERDAHGLDRILQKIEMRCEPPAPLHAVTPSVSAGAIGRRSQRSAGAMRCDDDVGVRLALLDTLRI